jgi:hypothetical protein
LKFPRRSPEPILCGRKIAEDQGPELRRHAFHLLDCRNRRHNNGCFIILFLNFYTCTGKAFEALVRLDVELTRIDKVPYSPPIEP